MKKRDAKGQKPQRRPVGMIRPTPPSFEERHPFLTTLAAGLFLAVALVGVVSLWLAEAAKL